jgi:hypothetical protein
MRRRARGCLGRGGFLRWPGFAGFDTEAVGDGVDERDAVAFEVHGEVGGGEEVGEGVGVFYFLERDVSVAGNRDKSTVLAGI